MEISFLAILVHGLKMDFLAISFFFPRKDQFPDLKLNFRPFLVLEWKWNGLDISIPGIEMKCFSHFSQIISISTCQ